MILLNKNRTFQLTSSLFLCVFLVQCALGPRKEPPKPALPSAKKQLAQAQIDLAAGSTQRALKRLKTIIRQHEGSDIADDAHILMGKIYYDSKKYKSAYTSYMAVVDSKYLSPIEADAALGAAKSLVRMGRLDEALGLTDRGLKHGNLSQSTKLDIQKVRYDVLTQLGDRLDALKTAVFISLNESKSEVREKYQLRARDLVEGQLSNKELEAVASDSQFAFVRVYALFKVGALSFEEKDFSRAKDYFEEVVELDPESQLAEQAQEIIKQIEARRKVNPYMVGAVLPLTGRHKNVAIKTLKGLQLGLGIFGSNRSGLSLAVVDSEGNPDSARRAVERLVTEDHVIAIVGSLLSRTSTSTAEKANELGVPSLALSQKAGLTEVGPHVFRNAVTSEMQVKHLVREAMGPMGLKKFAILYPNDKYGVEYANLFVDQVLARGGQIRGAQVYTSGETDFSDPIRRLIGTFYLEDRKDEYRLEVRDWYKGQKTISKRTEPPIDLLKPVVDFDAIFIPDSVKAVGQIAPMLTYHNVQNVKLLGTNLWNSPSLARRGKELVEGSLFVDTLLSSDDEFRKSSFFKEFVAEFGYEPGIFEAQAYDAGLLLRQMTAEGLRSRVNLRERLTEIEDFRGSMGQLSMSPHRELNRPLFSLTVNKGQIVRSKGL